MPRYRLCVCETVWEYFYVDMEASDADTASLRAIDRLRNTGEFTNEEEYPPIECDTSEGSGDYDVIECVEVPTVVKE